MTDTSPLITDETLRQEQSNEVSPILYQPETAGLEVTKEKVNFFGISLPRSLVAGERSLDPRTFAHYIDDTSAVELQRNIAASWILGQPILLEGGTSIGKTETVRRMTSLLGWELYDITVSSQSDVDDFLGKPMVNTERTSEDDPEFIYVLGEMAEGLIAEDGKTKVIFLDEYNATSPGVVIKFHEIFDKYNKGQLYTLVNGKRVKLDKNKIKIVAATNTPGKGYLERNPLDPAQIRRWNYFKLANKLEESEKAGRALRVWGYKDKKTYFPRTLRNLTSRGERIPIEDLHSIPNLPDLIVKIANFHTAAEKLLTEGEIGRDQPQKFIYDFNSLMFKIKEFVENFYNGDINETVQAALYFYFCNMLHSKEDRNKLMIMINDVRIPQANDSRRQDRKLEPSTSEKISQDRSNSHITTTPEEATTSSQMDKTQELVETSEGVITEEDWGDDYNNDYDDDYYETTHDENYKQLRDLYNIIMDTSKSNNPDLKGIIGDIRIQDLLNNHDSEFTNDEISILCEQLVLLGAGKEIIKSVSEFEKTADRIGEEAAIINQIMDVKQTEVNGRLVKLTPTLIEKMLNSSNPYLLVDSTDLANLLSRKRVVSIIQGLDEKSSIVIFEKLRGVVKYLESFGYKDTYKDAYHNPLVSSLIEFEDKSLGNTHLDYFLSLEDKYGLLDSIISEFYHKFSNLSLDSAIALKKKGCYSVLYDVVKTKSMFAVSRSQINDLLTVI